MFAHALPSPMCDVYWGTSGRQQQFRHGDVSKQDVSRPALLWVLRDFLLDLRDAAGNTMDADEYLEQALHAATAGCSEVRQSILRFFNHRSCTTLVQPLEEAQSLAEVPYRSLRSEFRSAAEARGGENPPTHFKMHDPVYGL
eukprot:Skav210097  [mRNA]  locus=scaffold1510:421897:425629:- [translate_table: standard]